MASSDAPAAAFRQAWNGAEPGALLLLDTASGQTRVVETVEEVGDDQAVYVRRRYAISVKQARGLIDLADMCAAMGASGG